MQDDLWLEEWITQMRKHIAARPLLELGSGQGRDSRFLCEQGFSVVALDLSAEGLGTCTTLEHCLGVQADISRALPFGDDAFGVVLASLSLHYFPWENTLGIICEIRRVLVREGMLLLRVNAVDDFNFGAGRGSQIEKNYYLNESRRKRFFDRESVEQMLADMDIHMLRHRDIDRYGKVKRVWEAYAVA